LIPGIGGNLAVRESAQNEAEVERGCEMIIVLRAA